MEIGAGSRRSHHSGGDFVVKEAADGSSGSQEVCKDQHDLKVAIDDNYDTGRTSVEPNSVVSSSSQKDQDTRLESTRTKMGEVREENERLKMYLDRIMKEYQTLQMKFHDIAQQEGNNNDKNIHDRETEEENQLVSLSLGRAPSDSRKEEKSKVSESSSSKRSLSLGLDSKLQTSTLVATENSSNPSPANSLEELKDGAGETWPPSKALTNAKRSGDDEVSAPTPAAKKARVSVRARCDTPTMNDGCQWRKYGQKISKGNPCPRAYYRCTVAPNCPVRKQVQRCAQDMSILITTYEGNHNHPLSMSATAMASTTSAAASMLLSGSSQQGTSTSAQLHGLNLNLSDPNNIHKSNLFLHNTSVSSSYPPSFPTITLDLTTSNNLIPSSSSHQLTRFNSSYTPRHSYPPTSLNFSSSEATAMEWGSGVLNYGSSTAHQQQYTNSRSQFGTLNYNLGLGNGQPQNIYQSYMQQKNSNASTYPVSNLPDTLAAATKAITADPAFQSVLAAALTSIIGGGSGGGAPGGGGEGFGEKMKWGEVFPAGDAAASSGSGCASSYLLNKSSAVANPQRPGGMMFLQPSLPFSTPKSTSTSPSETRDQNG